jgi:hypothetical protein
LLQLAFTETKNNIFPPEKEEKKNMRFNSHAAAAVKVFWKNTTRSAAQAWRFFQKPAGLDLD